MVRTSRRRTGGQGADEPNGKPITKEIHPRLTRRGFAAAWLGGLLLPGAAMAQESPPIEPRDGTTPIDDDEEIIQPEPTVELEPDTDAGTIVQVATGSDVRYFAETGHNLDQPFLAAWDLAGGVSGPGVPISEPRLVEGTGTVRQDFQSLALLYDPTAGDDGALWAAPLPAASIQSLAPAASRAVVSGCTVGSSNCEYFAETGTRSAGSSPISGATMGRCNDRPARRPSHSAQWATRPRSSNARCSKVRPIARSRCGRSTSTLPAGQYSGDEAFLPVPPTLGTTTLVTADEGLAPAVGVRIRGFRGDCGTAEQRRVHRRPGRTRYLGSRVRRWILRLGRGRVPVDGGDTTATRPADSDLAAGCVAGDRRSAKPTSDPNRPQQAPPVRTLAHGEEVWSWIGSGAKPWSKTRSPGRCWKDGGYVYARNIVRACAG